MDDLAPIVLFVYSRPEHTRRTLEALAANDLADRSSLYIYSDGPKYGALAEDLEAIREVRSLIRSRPWCKEVRIIESEYNRGLADSIVRGVTEVVNRHGRVIVLEDDIVTRRGFLRYMNDALEMYADDERVMHISGMIFGTPQSVPAEGTSFLRILSCHGWGTWKRAWDHYVADVDLLFERLNELGISKREFDIDGSATFYKQLIANRDGRLRTWAVRWYASWLTAGGLSLFPHRSLLTNIGHDESGEHAPAAFYNGETCEEIHLSRIPVVENTPLRREIDEIWRRGREAMRGKARHSSGKTKLKAVLRVLGAAKVKQACRRWLERIYPELRILREEREALSGIRSSIKNSQVSSRARLYPPVHFKDSCIGDYTYIARNAWVSNTEIGRFCSIGPNFTCGWGIHPLDGISTSPMFYSTAKQNGFTLCKYNKIQERKPIKIGNDVFIGMNVTVLDGVTIGDGAVIGAGCVVSKDVPPYAIVVGNPMRILRYRFSEDVIKRLQEIAWWDWPLDKLKQIEEHFFRIEDFIELHCYPREAGDDSPRGQENNGKREEG